MVTKAGREGSADPRPALHGSTWDLSVCGVEWASGPGSRLWELWGRRAGSSDARLTTRSKRGHGSHKSVAVGSSLLTALCSYRRPFSVEWSMLRAPVGKARKVRQTACKRRPNTRPRSPAQPAASACLRFTSLAQHPRPSLETLPSG